MNLSIYVFDNELSPLGAVDVITGLTWTEKFSDAGNFELWCPVNDHNVELLLEDNIVWPGGETAGIIEFKELVISEDNTASLHIQGRLLSGLLDYRVIYPTLITSGTISQILCTQVDTFLVNPEDEKRKIPGLEIDPEQPSLGPTVSYQKTGDSVLMEASKLGEANSLGFKVRFAPKDKKMTFCVYQGVDKTLDQGVVAPLLFSSDLDDILDSSYLHNKSELRNVAYVLGEDSGANRKLKQLGDSSGFSRKELFVDARDIQSETESGEKIPEEEYFSMLEERGLTTLEDYKDIEVFSATIRTRGVTTYTYGVDYFLGDRVTVYDRRLKVKTNALITQVTTTWDEEGKVLDVVFGYEQPTLANKLKRRK